MKKLTATGIDSLPVGDHADSIVTGLVLRVGARRNSWTLRYRAGGQRHKQIIGFYVKNAPEGSDSLPLSAAREKAREILGRVDAGVPVAEQPKPIHPRDALTLGRLVDLYEEHRLERGEKNKSLPLALRTIRGGLAAYLELPAKAFGKQELKHCRDTIFKRAPTQSSAFLRYVSPVLKWAAQEDHIDHDISGDVAKRKAVVKRERVLTDSEIRAIWEAAGNMTGRRREAAENFGKLVKFLLITGQRRDEGAGIRYSDVLDGKWKQLQNKSSRPHLVPLPPLALSLLGEGEPGDYAFAGVQGKISGFSRLKADLDKLSGVSNWRLHDLRRTAATRMQELGIEEATVSAVLNHSVGGVTGIYLRGELEKQKAKALATWAAHLQKIVSQKPTNVVRLPTKRNVVDKA